MRACDMIPITTRDGEVYIVVARCFFKGQEYMSFIHAVVLIGWTDLVSSGRPVIGEGRTWVVV